LPPQKVEMAAYSVAWAVLGGALLGAGIRLNNVLLRWASLAVIMVTICKVFLVDLADLHGLDRVLSLGGLGLSLIATAFVYLHFVFPKPAPAASPAEPAGPA
jgi:uncharacterized membrane protein